MGFHPRFGLGLGFKPVSRIGRNPLLADYGTTLLAETGLVGLWQLQEANASSTPTPADSKGSSPLSIFRFGTGVFAQRRSLLKWDQAKSSYLFSDKASGNCFNGAAGAPLDMTGAAAFSAMAMVAPNVTRTGSAIRYTMFSKRAQTANAPGYEFGLVWDGTKTVLYLIIASTDTNAIEVRTTDDLPNATARHVAFTYDGSKTAAGVTFFVNGRAVVATTVLDALTGSATNATKFNIGSRGGNIQFLSAWLSHVGFFAAQLTPARVKALAYEPVKRTPPYTGRGRQKKLLIDDNDSDIDGEQMVRRAIASHLAGDTEIVGYIGSTSNVNSVAAIEAMFLAAGIVIPYGQYQGSDHDSGSLWTTAVRNNFNPTKSQSSYMDAVTAIRTILAAQPDGSTIYVDTGPLHVTQAFLQSPADGISSLTGLQMMAAKCPRLYNMGGYASNVAAEFNFAHASAAASWVYINCPVPIYNVPFEMLSGVNVGTAGNGDIDPARKAYELQKQASYSRSSAYDLMALEASSDPNHPDIAVDVQGTCAIDAGTGVCVWTPGAGTHFRLKIATSAATILPKLENGVNDAI